MEPDQDTSQTERRIMAMMRKVLSAVARDTAPAPGRRNILSDQTVQDIRDCLSVISLRERQLAKQSELQRRMKPQFADQPGKSTVIPVNTLKNNKEE